MLRGKSNNYEQSGGEHSVNLQGENVHYHGITYRDAKEIAQDVFEKNFRELSTEAAEVATKRANEILDQLMDKLQQIEDVALESFKDPDVQYQIFNAQKEYARNGDKDLAEMLTNLLVERVKEPDRNLKQVVLNESMTVLPKLTSAQVNVLTWIFIVRLMKINDIANLEGLKGVLHTFYHPLMLDTAELQLRANYMHLQYAGCGTVSLGEISFEEVFRRAYPNLFQPETNILETVEKLSPKVKAIADLWNNTEMKQFEMTSVGIAIAHANMCRVIGVSPNLEIWIS
jgi:hypothetical protein